MPSRIPLFTSISPVLKRLDDAGEDIGILYQKQCVESWLDHGFQVFSLNIVEEIVRLESAYPSVTFVQAVRDGRSRVGRPLVYIDDLVQALCATNAPVGGITNSDILFNSAPDIAFHVRDQAIGSCLYSHRAEIDQPGGVAGAATDWRGIDTFFFDLAIARGISLGPCLIGAPWWDFWLPLALRFKGAVLRRSDAQLFYHLRHAVAWNMKEKHLIYLAMTRYLMELTKQELATVAPDALPALLFLCAKHETDLDWCATRDVDRADWRSDLNAYMAHFASLCERFLALSRIETPSAPIRANRVASKRLSEVVG